MVGLKDDTSVFFHYYLVAYLLVRCRVGGGIHVLYGSL